MLFSPEPEFFFTRNKYYRIFVFGNEKSVDFLQITKFLLENCEVELFLFCIFQIKIFFLL
jgi:hypothetical protein